jgi:hypothetical protein
MKSSNSTIELLKTMCADMKNAHVTLDIETLDMYMKKYFIDIMVLMDYWEIFKRLTISIPKKMSMHNN